MGRISRYIIQLLFVAIIIINEYDCRIDQYIEDVRDDILNREVGCTLECMILFNTNTFFVSMNGFTEKHFKLLLFTDEIKLLLHSYVLAQLFVSLLVEKEILSKNKN